VALNKNPLLDDEFLKELYRHREKEVFAKIIALTLQNDPIEEIQGQVTGGSVSLDGSSSVRRTCTLSLVAKDLNINQYYWGLKNRFKLYVGLRNTVGYGYEDIIWFPMGTYVISAFTTSQAVSSYTINITGKDKMTLLNGELSGSLFASVDFGKEEYYQNGITTISYIPIKNIIREAVHAYADEPWENIVVNDLDDYGIELLDYNGNDPMYLLFRLNAEDNTKDCYQSFFNGEQKVYPAKLKDGQYILANIQTIDGEPVDNTHGISISEIANYKDEDGNVLNYDPRIELDLGGVHSITATKFFLSDIDENKESIINYNYIYTVVKVENGQTCGYRLTDITYPGDLILSVGEPITAMLDKLVAMLGNFEYFYDIDGRFIFQRKPTFIDKTWNNIKTGNQNSYVTTIDETYVESAFYSSPITWTFGDSFLVTSYANNPALSNVRNDFSIWGTKASVTGSELPVHLRYAVDKKPTYYKAFDGKEWVTKTGQWWVKKDEGIVDVTYDQLVEMVKDEAREKIRKRIKRNIENFEPTHKVIDGLQKPTKNKDGSWTAGWWDLRDWHTYYKYLTGNDPINHMRMYATNPSGDVTQPKGYVENLDFSTFFNGQIIRNSTSTNNIWLFNAYKYEDGSFYVSVEHNGTEDKNIQDDDGITRWYIAPFSGCSIHTYEDFEDWFSIMDKPEEERIHRNKKVVEAYAYFYSPNFPTKTNDETFIEYIEEEVEKQLSDEEIDALIAEKGYRFVDRMPKVGENGKISEDNTIYVCDWREIIFQMALDYRKHNHDDDFYLKVRTNNGLDLNNQWYYPSGRTGYEQYYVDMEGFWRQLYCPPQLMEVLYPSGVWTERNTSGGWVFTTDAIKPDSEQGIYFSNPNGIVYGLNMSYDDWQTFKWVDSWIEDQDTNDGWNVEILNAPENLNFWFDFLEADESTDLVKYSVPAIGDRSKSVNDNMVKAIYFRETPTALYTTDISTVDRKSGYTYLQYNDELASVFNISSQGKSAYDVMEEYINLYLYCIESISINSIPIYHLQPNTKVMVYDEDSKINGEYLVNRITIPLTFNGIMSVSAVKSAEIIY